jgi:endonuclease G
MDPRVPQNAQLLEDFYSKDKGAFDKGNIVARSSVAWGTTYEELRRANVDSYHATNFSPQTASFNQRGAWAQLEERVQELGRRTPLVVFAGPVLSAEDPIFVGQENENPAGVQIPRQFWKIVVDFELGRLRASAFILRQDLSGVNVQPASMEPEGAWRISVSELEAILGIVSFPAEIHNADVALSSQESSYELTADLERYR